MINPYVDDLSMMTYLSQFPEAKLKEGAPVGPKEDLKNITKVKVSGSGITGEGTRVGEPAIIIVDCSESGVAPVTAKVTTPSGDICDIEFEPKSKGSKISDGTYIPEERGYYWIEVDFDDEPLPDSPYQVPIGGNPDRVRIDGEGLKLAVVDEDNIIDVSTDKAGPGDVTVEFTGPIGSPPVKQSVVKVDDSHVQVHFSPETVGVYKANVLFNGSPVTDKPCEIPTIDLRKVIVTGPGIQSGNPAKAETYFDVDVQLAGDADLDVSITDPEGKDIPIEVTPLSKNAHRVKYTPQQQGNNVINIRYGGKALKHSPYIINVDEPGYVICSGDGLTHAIANEKAEFEVDTTKLGPGLGTLGLAMEGPTEVMDIKYEPGDENGKFNVSYTAPLPGVYKITVKYNDEVVPGAPFEVTVEKELTDISKVKVSGSGITGEGAIVGKTAKIIVDCSESGNGSVTGNFTTPSGDTGDIEFEPISGSTVYEGSYIPEEPGHYLVEINFDGEPTPDSPYQVPISNPGGVRLDGKGLKLAVVDEDNVIDVYTDKAGPGDVTVEFTGPIGSPPVKQSVVKVDDSHVQVHFSPETVGVYEANVLFNGSPVTDKPREIPTIDLSKVIVTGPGIQSGNPAKAETYFDVDVQQAGDADLEVSITDPEGKDIPIEVTSLAKHTYKITYTPQQQGNHIINIRYGGKGLENSPYIINVDEPRYVKCSGDGLTHAIANEKAEFEVDTTKAAPGTLGLAMEGPIEITDIKYEPGDENGKFNVSYTAPLPGVYKITVKYNDEVVPGAPFEVTVEKELTDISKVKVSGSGITGEGAIVGKPAKIIVDCSESGNGSVTGNFTTPSGDTGVIKFEPISKGSKVYEGAYIPNEPGYYVLDVQFDGESTPDSPYQVPISNPGGVRLDGEGLKLAVVDEDNVIDVYTDKAGPGDVTVEFTGPIGSPPVKQSVVKVDDSHVQVHFSPETVDVYKANVLFNGSPVTDKPCEIPTIDLSKVIVTGPGIQSGNPAKAETYFDVDVQQAGDADLEVSITDPEGKDIPIEVTPLSKNAHRVKYTPQQQGNHVINIRYGGKALKHSPYIINVDEPRYVKCSGDGLTHAIANEKAEFEVDTTKAGSGTLGLAMEGPTEVTDIKCEPGDENGKFNVSYTAPLPGVYKITVKYNDEVVPGAPFEVTVEKELTDISKVKVSGSGITGKGAIVGKPAKIIVDCSESGNGSVTGNFTTPSGDTGDIEFEPNSKGSKVYEGAYIPNEPGYYVLEVQFDGEPTPDSPYQVPISNPGGVRLDGEGLELAVVDEDNVIDVYTDKAGPGDVTVEFTGPIGSPPVKQSVVKVDDSHVQVHFSPETVGVYKANVLFNGSPVTDKPCEIPTIDLSKVVVTGPGIQSGNPAKAETYFDVDVQQAGDADLDVSITDPEGKDIPIEVTPLSKNAYRVKYTPQQQGNHIINIRYGGKALKHSPYIINVDEPRYVKCSGDGLTHAIANEKAEFEVDTTKAGPGPGTLGLAMEGPTEVMDIKYEPGDENGKFNVSYTAPLPGVYKITVKYNDEVVPGAPFEVMVEKELTDISKVKVSGSGITGKGAIVGKPAKIIVDCSESGNGSVTGNFTTPSGDTGVIKFEPISKGSKVYEGAYIPNEPGYYVLDVQFDGEPTPDSPYQVPISNPGGVRLDGEGLKLAVVDEDNVIDVYTDKAGPGDVTVEFTGPIGSPPVKQSVVKVDDSHVQIHFSPETVDVYKANVLFNGSPVTDKPCEIPTIDLSKVIVTGPGIQSGNPAKAETYFDVDVQQAGDADLEVSITDPEGRDIPIEVTPLSKNAHRVKYTPQQQGNHVINIRYGGKAQKHSPYIINVDEPGYVICSGDGLTHAIAKEKAEFEVDTTKAGPGTLGLAMEGPTEVTDIKYEPGDENGKFNVSYTAPLPGVYKITVKYNDKEVPGAPFEVPVRVGDPEVSCVVVTNLESANEFQDKYKSGGESNLLEVSKETEVSPAKEPEVKTIIDREPLLDSESTIDQLNAIYLAGMGLEHAVVGINNIIDIYTDRAGLDVTVEFTGPLLSPFFKYRLIKVDINHFQVHFTPRSFGVYKLYILLNGVPAKKKPREILITRRQDIQFSMGKQSNGGFFDVFKKIKWF